MASEAPNPPAPSGFGPSRRVVLAALLGATAGACGGGSAVTTFDLTAPRPGPRFGGAPRGQIVVAEPAAIQTLEADRILVKDASGTVSYLSGAQWADRLPKLIQARLINTFENASKLKAVSRPGERVSPDYMLTTEIRAFQIATPAAEAFVEVSARLVHDRSGRIAAGRVFSARVPVAKVDAGHAANGLDAALSKVLLDIVRWVSTGR
ncbi:MAG TPA: ABC-type transport auxiliary lipoprotein family protein [Beijerinckiaceae bacterium]|jgi:cholesterol transport system auxiliary component|nr:transporter [Microvirga sp.]HZB38815.1 ABC-type transport auxiliary lipoprotein family protein [Beijerinckiaceae bacterium]